MATTQEKPRPTTELSDTEDDYSESESEIDEVPRQSNQQLQRRQQQQQGQAGGQQMQQQQPAQEPAKKEKGGGGAPSVRLDLNLEIEVTLKARIHGDLTLALLT